MTPLLLGVLAGGCFVEDLVYDEVIFTPEELDRLALLTPPPPAPEDPTNAVADDPAAAALGQYLFFDPGMSADDQVSCATCHDPELGFSDDLPVAEGLGRTARRAPQLRTSAWNRWFFWDGRADSAWAQALGPIESPVEHGSSRLEVAHHLHDDPALAEAYEAIFGPLPPLDDQQRFPPAGRPVPEDPDRAAHLAWSSMSAEDQHLVNEVFANVGKSIAAYERRLLPGPAPFDTLAQAILDGDEQTRALSLPSVARGIKLYLGDADCALCHSGPTFSDQEFHNLGLGTRPWLEDDDPGRYAGVAAVLEDEFNGAGRYSDDPEAGAEKLAHLTQRPELLGAFRTPSFRQAAAQDAFMHGGQMSGSLRPVLEFYDRLDEVPDLGQREDLLVPLELSEDEVEYVVLMIESLMVDDLDPALLTAPESPF